MADSLGEWFKKRLFGPSFSPEQEASPLGQFAAQNRKDFMDALQPYTDLVTGTFQKLPPDRSARLQDTVASMIGPQTGIMAGRMAKTANLNLLKKAAAFEKAGLSPDEIWKATGWGRGKDWKWRFEIDDSKAPGFKADAPDAIKNTWGKKPEGNIYGENLPALENVYQHPELLKAYPELKDLSVAHTDDAWGYASEPTAASPSGKLGINSNMTPAGMNSTALHELQHHIQRLEGFARGGNSRSGIEKVLEGLSASDSPEADMLMAAIGKKYNQRPGWLGGTIYKHLAGETESRSVQARQAMNKLKRRTRPPWKDEDVPRQSQIPIGFRKGP